MWARFCKSIGCVMVLPVSVLAQAQAKASATTQKSRSAASETVGDLFSSGWIWAGVIALAGLLVLLSYVRKQSSD